MFNNSGIRSLLVMLTLIALGVIGVAQAGADWRETTNSAAANSVKSDGQCVRETDFMRRNHMELIKHDRDTTVHEGVRTVDGSLSECIACHVNKDDSGHFIPVNAEEGPGGEQFCASCHAYTSVTMDCFQCHSPVPN